MKLQPSRLGSKAQDTILLSAWREQLRQAAPSLSSIPGYDSPALLAHFLAYYAKLQRP